MHALSHGHSISVRTVCARCGLGDRPYGDPMEDLGWIRVNSWRCGEIDAKSAALGRARNCSPVTRRRAAKVDPDRVNVLGRAWARLRWGVMCCGHDATASRRTPNHSMERAMMGAGSKRPS